jgi:hypothetical protein
MNAKLAAISLVVAAAGLPLAPSAALAGCVTKHGKGWAFTEDLTRFQAWEIVAQFSGNWPIQTDMFRNERYTCNPDGSGYTCLSTIDICK